jgi:GT2 family glycosyltransferase
MNTSADERPSWTLAPGAPRVAAVIVTYNGALWLRKCIESLLTSQLAPAIIVVDNASSDDTVAIARSFDQITLIESGGNLGFGRGNNLGLALALSWGCDYAFILNQDAYVAPDALTILVQRATVSVGHGIWCPMQWNDDGTELDSTFLRYYISVHAPQLLNDALRGVLKPSYTLHAAPAAAWLLSRDFLNKVGGFDPLFFMYCEDDDLCSRAAHHGMQVAIVPAARFFHCRGFHGLVRTETTSRRIRRKTSRLRSSLVRDIKHPGGSLFKNTWHSVVEHTSEGIKQTIGRLDWVTGLATLLAIAGVVLELPRLAAHRRSCQETGPHWLVR